MESNWWMKRQTWEIISGETFNDVTFPIEYLNSTCNMKIRISYFDKYPGDEIFNPKEGGYSTPKCFELNTRGDCEAATKASPTTIAVVAIICLTVVIVAVIIARMLKKQRDKGETPEDEKELNDLYGTYSEGVEYNIANDHNPRYNEDGSTEDAFITDANSHYYHPSSTNNDNP